MFKNHHNARPSHGEINNLPSQTIPDQSMTVSEIMQRYAQGLGYSGPRVPSYDGGNDPLNGVNIETLDISEKHDMIDRVKEHIEDLKADAKLRSAPQAAKAPKKSDKDSHASEPDESFDSSANNPNPGKNSAGGKSH